MPATEILSLKGLCEAVALQVPHTAAQLLWSIATALWPWYWLVVAVGLAGWASFEVATRNGTAHYNSDNGFSPIFNSFIGVVVYAGLQALVYLTLSLPFGEMVYCMPWPYVLHALVFLSTGLLLHSVGFWPRLQGLDGRRSRKYRRY